MKKLSFGQRIGKKAVEVPIQLDGISDGLRIQLWNAISAFLSDLLGEERRDFEFRKGRRYYADDGFFLQLWHQFFKRDVGEIRNSAYLGVLQGYFKAYFLQADWVDLFEMIEFYLEYNKKEGSDQAVIINRILEDNHSGYRVVGNIFSPITNETEIAEIQEAIQGSKGVVLEHMKSAISFFAKGGKEGFRKSAGESLSALEALMRNLAGLGNSGATLPDAIKELKKNKVVHPALLEGIEKMYSFGSDAGGMRHALKENEKVEVDAELAKFLLVVSSATVNLLNKHAK